MAETGAVVAGDLDTSSKFDAESRSVYFQYEIWLRAGFSRAAYMARDILLSGAVQPETSHRVRNELKGMAIEKLGEPYVTSFEYLNVDGSLCAEDGEPFIFIFTRGYDKVSRDAEDNPQLAFLLKRHEADLDNALFIQELSNDPNIPIGTRVIINSPSPSANELGVPVRLLEDYNYRPSDKLAVQWIATKTADGIKLQTSSLFDAESHQLAEATSVVSGQPVDASDRELMPFQRTVFFADPDEDIAHQLQLEFDAIIERDTGILTFHGLQSYEHEVDNPSLLVETAEFNQALSASESIIEQVSESLVLGKFTVDIGFMQQILAMQKADGSFELSGSDRDSVMRTINTRAPSWDDFYSSLLIAQKAADAIVWASLRDLYDGVEIRIVSSNQEAVLDGIKSVQTHRQLGAIEYDCPGGGSSKSNQMSIFDMSAEQLASAFMRKVFTTNCPLCQQKNITATQENGRITCGTCNGCVDVCTGEVIKKSQKREKTKEVSGKLVTKKIVGVVDLLFYQWEHATKKRKAEALQRQKVKKYEKIAV